MYTQDFIWSSFELVSLKFFVDADVTFHSFDAQQYDSWLIFTTTKCIDWNQRVWWSDLMGSYATYYEERCAESSFRLDSASDRLIHLPSLAVSFTSAHWYQLAIYTENGSRKATDFSIILLFKVDQLRRYSKGLSLRWTMIQSKLVVLHCHPYVWYDSWEYSLKCIKLTYEMQDHTSSILAFLKPSPCCRRLSYQAPPKCTKIVTRILEWAKTDEIRFFHIFIVTICYNWSSSIKPGAAQFCAIRLQRIES